MAPLVSSRGSSLVSPVGSARITCVRCRRPDDRCVCGLAGTVDNRVGITILQHPGERHHPFNTARLAKDALRDVAVHVVWPDDQRRLLHRGPVPAGAALLYPRHDALALETLAAEDRPTHLVVIDGTWAQARTVYRDNPWLEALPHVRLSPASPSRYRIRREPARDHVSTLESIALALAVLEPGTAGLERVLDGFLAMVDAQADRPGPRARRRKVRARPSVLERLASGWDQLVVGYAEAVGLHGRGGRPSLVQWAAVRPSSGEVFSARVALAQGLTPSQARNTRLDPSAPGTAAELAERWATFGRPGDLLACWSDRAAPLLADTLGRPVDALSLRAAYGNLRSGVGGYLDDVAAREGLVAVPVEVPGRAGERLGYAVALASFLGDQRRARTTGG